MKIHPIDSTEQLLALIKIMNDNKLEILELSGVKLVKTNHERPAYEPLKLPIEEEESEDDLLFNSAAGDE